MSNQLNIFDNASRRYIMISLHSEYYNQLCSDQKKFEYRRGKFIKEAVHAFVYCSSPVMEVGALVELGTPISGSPHKIAEIKEKETPGSYDTMMDWMKDFKEASAVPIERVQVFKPVPLKEIKEKFPSFHPPQRFIYVDKNKELLEFLKQKSHMPADTLTLNNLKPKLKL